MKLCKNELLCESCKKENCTNCKKIIIEENNEYIKYKYSEYTKK